MLDWIFEGVVTWVSTVISQLLDAVSGLFLDVLNTDMTVMEEYFPFLSKAFNVMQYMAWAILFLITVWQLFRVFGGPITEAENPWILLSRGTLFALLIGYAEPIFSLLLDIATVPYTAMMEISMTSEEFTFAGVEAVLRNGLTTILASVSVVGLLLLVILEIALGWNYFKLLLETVERYIVVGILCYTSPLAYSMGASKDTAQVFRSWCRMVGSQLLLLIMNVWFLRAFSSSVGQFIGSGGTLTNGNGSIFLWLFCALAFLKTAQRFDSYLASMGLNVAQTGSSMGMELLMAAKAITGVTGGAKSAGSVFRGGSAATGTGAAASGFAAGFANRFKGNSYVRDAVVDGGTRMGAGGSVEFVGRIFGGMAARNGATLTGDSISSVASKAPNISGTIGGEIADRSLGNYMPQFKATQTPGISKAVPAGSVSGVQTSVTPGSVPTPSAQTVPNKATTPQPQNDIPTPSVQTENHPGVIQSPSVQEPGAAVSTVPGGVTTKAQDLPTASVQPAEMPEAPAVTTIGDGSASIQPGEFTEQPFHIPDAPMTSGVSENLPIGEEPVSLQSGETTELHSNIPDTPTLQKMPVGGDAGEPPAPYQPGISPSEREMPSAPSAGNHVVSNDAPSVSDTGTSHLPFYASGIYGGAGQAAPAQEELPQLQISGTQITGGQISTTVTDSDGRTTQVEMFRADQYEKPDAPHTVVTAADGSQWYQMASGPSVGHFYDGPSFTGSPTEAPQVAAAFPDAPEGTMLRTVEHGVVEASTPDGRNSMWLSSAYYQEPDAPHTVMEAGNGMAWYAMEPHAETPNFEQGEAAAAYNQAQFQNFLPGFEQKASSVDVSGRPDGHFEVRHENGSGTRFYDASQYAQPRGDHQIYQDVNGRKWYAIGGEAAVERKPVFQDGKPVYDGDKLRTITVDTVRYRQTPAKFQQPQKRTNTEIKTPKRKR